MAQRNYDLIARVYDALGVIYSGGQIHAAKNSQLAEMRSGDRVLYVGVGPGEDAVLAAEHGAQVTCLDVSAQMLRQAEARMQRLGCQAEFLQADICEHRRQNHYDVVVVNFFLNVFDEAQMQAMLAHLVTLVRPGGKLLISDFAFPRGNVLARAVQAAYWGVTDLFYYLLGLCTGTRSTTTPAIFRRSGWNCAAEQRFRPYGIGPGGFAALTAVRTSAPAAGPTEPRTKRAVAERRQLETSGIAGNPLFS